MPNTSSKVRREKGLFEAEKPDPVLMAGCAERYAGLAPGGLVTAEACTGAAGYCVGTIHPFN
jgi:hypothetical protein